MTTKTIGRSILAFIAAIAVTFILSYTTDALLVATGLMESESLPDSVAIVMLIIAYRTAYNVLGAFILAKLAPTRPMAHVMVLAALGILGSLSAMAAISDSSQYYYPIILSILVLPSAWLGAKIALRK